MIQASERAKSSLLDLDCQVLDVRRENGIDLLQNQLAVSFHMDLHYLQR
jgi:hypothetical protein